MVQRHGAAPGPSKGLPPHAATTLAGPSKASPPHAAKVMQRQTTPFGAAGGSGTAQRALLVSEVNQKGKMLAFTTGAEVRVGRREAFFKNSKATHAVFSLDNTIYGLKGDLGGGEIDVDDNTNNAPYTWVTDAVYLGSQEMNLFWAVAQKKAIEMTYTLVTHNCYTPVTAALVAVRGAMQETDKRVKIITQMLKDLAEDNFGLGSYKHSHKFEDVI
ncbi:hypothetical protein [Polyangium sp. y55x31]|uniref:hypothetical protein n=1 Tax=Polyangium sp. y55x31 TaxID=3042688 RepID=UPI0024828469|nr:hypothetical protein [Polyangium sp. y55x31]